MSYGGHFAFFDEGSKREIRRAILKAVAIPGYQVPFASREMPIARGWGTGGLQLTLSIIGRQDRLKVIDQGSDDSVNAVNIRKFVEAVSGVETCGETERASLIQSRHRVPETPLSEGQILVLQVPTPEPLRAYEPSEAITRRLHAERDYSGAYLMLLEEIIRHGRMTSGADHPVEVNGHYVMAPSPIPRFDNPKLDMNPALVLLGAGREKKIYAVPPYTRVASLAFTDHPFQPEDMSGRQCRLCGSQGVFMDEFEEGETGSRFFQCNDSDYCAKARAKAHAKAQAKARAKAQAKARAKAQAKARAKAYTKSHINAYAMDPGQGPAIDPGQGPAKYPGQDPAMDQGQGPGPKEAGR